MEKLPAFAKWPLADQLMWQSLQRVCSPLDDAGGLAHLRPTARKILDQAYRKWMGWIMANAPDALTLPPAERASMDQLRLWLASMEALRPMTRLFYVEGVLRVLRAAAPDADWRAQMNVVRNLKQLAGSGDPSRKWGRILSSGVLLRAGLAYATNHPKAKPTELERALRIQTGAMIAMLALMPVRCITYRLLKLGESIHVEETRILVTVPGEHMKSGHPWEAEVPAVVLPLLRQYLDEVRPWLMQRRGQTHDYLWLTRLGTPFTNGYLGVRIALATLEATGVRVSPHLFRDAAATTLARESPQAARLIRPVLAHTNSATAEKHYNHAGSIDAGRTYAAIIARKKGQS